MKEVVINVCFGGFSLSRTAVARMAELQGRECYFFTTTFGESADRYVPSEREPKEGRDLFWCAFDIPNPNEVLADSRSWHELSDEDKQTSHALYDAHDLTNRPDNRSDPLLLQVVKELGEKANGGCADLRIVEIPDDVQFTIEEYDGNEHIAEIHRAWR